MDDDEDDNDEDISSVNKQVNVIEDDRKIQSKEEEEKQLKANITKWLTILFNTGILCFFFYDAMWSDPYLASRYYEVEPPLDYLFKC